MHTLLDNLAQGTAAVDLSACCSISSGHAIPNRFYVDVKELQLFDLAGKGSECANAVCAYTL